MAESGIEDDFTIIALKMSNETDRSKTLRMTGDQTLNESKHEAEQNVRTQLPYCHANQNQNGYKI